MPDWIAQAVFFDGLWILALAAFVSGVVRGFSGFGTAMIFMPMAALVLEPIVAIMVLVIFDIFAPLPLVPRALREGEPRDVAKLTLGAAIGAPIGLALLSLLEPEVFRWLVSILTLCLLGVLIAGWRYRNPLGALATVFVGWVSGLMGGIAGLPGPPVILSYMSSPRRPAAIRANTLLYLVMIDILMLIIFVIKGVLTSLPVVLGLIIAVPSSIGGLIGQKLFNPDYENAYRICAYCVIAASAIAGLPVWD